MSATLKPPDGLADTGRALWSRVVADVPGDWELDARDLTLLESAARAAERAAELDAIADADGLMIGGSKGQWRIHPAVGEARQQRHLSAVLLGKIALAPPEPKTGALNGRQRADLRRAVGGGPRGAL